MQLSIAALEKFWMTEESPRRDAACCVSLADRQPLHQFHQLNHSTSALLLCAGVRKMGPTSRLTPEITATLIHVIVRRSLQREVSGIPRFELIA
jgi:hypothetical protein